MYENRVSRAHTSQTVNNTDKPSIFRPNTPSLVVPDGVVAFVVDVAETTKLTWLDDDVRDGGVVFAADTAAQQPTQFVQVGLSTYISSSRVT